MSRARETQDFVDALRVVLGLRPLYRQGRVDSSHCYVRRACSDMLLASGDGNRRVTSSPNWESKGTLGRKREYFDLSTHYSAARGTRRRDGHRVGASFMRAKL